MAARNALVLVNGAIRELPAGDTLNGASGGGGSVALTSKFSVLGLLSSTTNLGGTARWYPDKAIVISSVYFSIGTAPSGNVTMTVRRNGVDVVAAPVCSAGQNLSNTVSPAFSVALGEYLTVTITNPSGADATLSIIYT